MGDEFIFRHSLEMITARVVRMRNPRDAQYLGYKIRSNYDTCTFECSNKLRHNGIDAVYVGVELLYKHDGTTHGSLSPSKNDTHSQTLICY